MSAALQDKVIERSRGLLEPGEAVRRVYVAQGGINPWAQVLFCAVGVLLVRAVIGDVDLVEVYVGCAVGAMLGGAVALALTSRRVILRTERALVVLSYGRFGPVRPTRVVARLPKETPVGPLEGLWSTVVLNGEKLWIHKRHYGVHEVAPSLPGA
ncbi:hypothetical protein [Streptomyces jeddahensis]|uniref:Uncharacterized protein n=1 Tax=Streptomyces jeddahensis TaxID=1716141 RepID=A0A177HZP2_9ACTN|nr:hypothetical protein [Streptomyces jeddahensis]OAH16285.1 hypothetical protein STSP_03600 [Streptomyces jeddahensis]